MFEKFDTCLTVAIIPYKLLNYSGQTERCTTLPFEGFVQIDNRKAALHGMLQPIVYQIIPKLVFRNPVLRICGFTTKRREQRAHPLLLIPTFRQFFCWQRQIATGVIIDHFTVNTDIVHEVN